MGVSKTMDLLFDSHEVICNIVLLLVHHLMHSNSHIQKIIAFENAFQWLMNIVHREGYSDRGIIVEDCIAMMQNLLKGHSTNQAFFGKTSSIQHSSKKQLKLAEAEDWQQHLLVQAR